MKKIITLLPFCIILFVLFCSDMSKKVSDPEGIKKDEVSTGDQTAPTITVFTLTSSDSALTPDITFTLEGTDNVGITGWLINESSTAPEATDTNWVETKPTGYTLSGGAGTYIIYAWAKDTAGNVSASESITLDYEPDDVTAPTITTFTGPSITTSATISITLEGTDDVEIAGWLVNETSTAPLANDGGWVAIKPAQYTLSGFTSHTLYAWAKDASGNVSYSLSLAVQYNMPGGVWGFTNWNECLWQ